MKSYFQYNILLAAIGLMTLGLTACDNDTDIVYADGIEEIRLSGTTGDIVLNENAQDALALTLHWNANGNISTSNPAVAVPDGAVSNTIEFSDDMSFEKIAAINVSKNVYSRQFTCRELNALVSQLGFEGGIASTMYARIKGSLSANTDAFYSNVITMTITPFQVDMTVGMYLDSSKNDTGRTLRSADSDHVYSGFIGAGSWENWWFRESDGHVWGNDDVTGTPFIISSSDSAWNFWYPGVSGCYYTIVNVPANEWSALLLPQLFISGDIEGEMTYVRKTNKWVYTYTAASAGTINITISGTGKQYNVATGTDDAAAIDTPIGFGGSADALTFGQTASSVSLSIPSAGETTIELDLNNPAQWTLAIGNGSEEPTPAAAPYLYLSGVYGEWTFDWYVKLYNEDDLTYGAALPVDSEWGYRIYPEADVWDNYYTMVPGGNGYEGHLVANGEDNIAAPEKGFYLFDISLSNMSYKLTSISKVSYTGLNDDWSLTEMTPGDTPGVYTAAVNKSANTPWGVKIVLNDNWDLFFGGNGTPGELVLYHDGFEGDNDLEYGEYTLTVDLAKGTYSYSK